MRGPSIIAALATLIAAVVAGPAAAACKLAKIAELPVTMTYGVPVVPAVINGKDARLVANSAAGFGVLHQTAAERFGLKEEPLPSGMTVSGATGRTPMTKATARDLTLMGSPFHNVEFLVDGNLSGEIDGVLGQNLLDIADVEYDLANGVIRLFRAEGCETTMLAYWDQAQPYSVLPLLKPDYGEREFLATASLNGADIRVEFATGDADSILSLEAARRAGVKPGGPGVKPFGSVGGDGGPSASAWIAPFASFKIGDEVIRNPRLRIGAIHVFGGDMLLGADFFLSHRIYVANSQGRIYLTYNGGPVFRLDEPAAGSSGQGPTPSPAPPAPMAGAGAPTDAAGFARRGVASAARRDYVAALADLDHAVAMEPAEPLHYFERSHVRLAAGQHAGALADLDQALRLKPDDIPSLLLRGGIRLADWRKDKDKPADRAADEAVARADLDAVARLDPSRRRAVADTYEQGPMYEAAVRQYDLWIAANPKDKDLPHILNLDCWDRALWGHEFDRALAACDAALAILPRNGAFLDSRGLVHLRLGQLDAAIADYSAAPSQDSTLAGSHYGRGVARLRQGRKAEGDADIAAAVKLQPGIADEMKGYGVTP